MSPLVWRAAYVLEAEAGAFARLGRARRRLAWSSGRDRADATAPRVGRPRRARRSATSATSRPARSTSLATADVIACEDTRRTRGLLTHVGIAAGRPAALGARRTTSLARVDGVVALVVGGSRVAFVTDAGMPGDQRSGRSARARLPRRRSARSRSCRGRDAATTALVLSGLPTDRFAFEGFLPRKGRARAERIAAIAAEPRTVVLYESPRRVVGHAPRPARRAADRTGPLPWRAS